MIVLCALLLAAEQPLVAVLELHNKLNAADRAAVDTGYLTDLVRTATLHELPSLRMMTRENMLVMLGAQGKKLEDCEGECEVETARRLGADLVISGEVLRFGGGLRLSLRLHRVSTGELLNGAQANGRGADELEGGVRATVSTLLEPLQPRDGAPRTARSRAGVEPASAEWAARGGFSLLLAGEATGFLFFGWSDSGLPFRTEGGAVRARAGLLRLGVPHSSGGLLSALEAGVLGEAGFSAQSGGAAPNAFTGTVGAYAGGGIGFGSFAAGDEWAGALVSLHWAPVAMSVAGLGVQLYPLGVEAVADFIHLHPEAEIHFRLTVFFRSNTAVDERMAGISLGAAYF